MNQKSFFNSITRLYTTYNIIDLQFNYRIWYQWINILVTNYWFGHSLLIQFLINWFDCQFDYVIEYQIMITQLPIWLSNWVWIIWLPSWWPVTSFVTDFQCSQQINNKLLNQLPFTKLVTDFQFSYQFSQSFTDSVTSK